jgi:60 kDa SS-A/Ro ribonucleoprotein
MSTKTYKNVLNPRQTAQTEAIPGKNQVSNSAGGFSFAVDVWTQFDRFLILGTEGGSYYASEKKLTLENANVVLRAIKEDGVRVVNRIVEISSGRRAPKNDPALFALALVMTHGDEVAKNEAYKTVSKVARIGTHILHLAEFVNGMRGWGRGIRRAFGGWYNEQEPLHLAQQLTKYANRDGWTHRDILRKAHVKPRTTTHDALFTDTVGKSKDVEIDVTVAEYMTAVEELKATRDAKTAVRLITDHKLPREVVPTELLNSPEVWLALLPHMGLEALVRNVATLTRVGVIAPLSAGQKLVLEKLGNADVVAKSGIHPIKVLAALLTYKQGHGMRGGNSWTPQRQIVDALDEMFYMAFKNVVPTGKRWVLGLDVSGSMEMGLVAGVPGLTPRMASAALAMMTLRTENPADTEVLGFTAGSGRTMHSGYGTELTKLGLTAKMSLDQVLAKISNLPFGGTDCALPILWAEKNNIAAEAFAIYTDSETWAGNIHPVQALDRYRQKTGIPAKLIVVGMVSSGFSIADPNDAGMLDVVGFDTATPSIMSDFVKDGF